MLAVVLALGPISTPTMTIAARAVRPYKFADIWYFVLTSPHVTVTRTRLVDADIYTFVIDHRDILGAYVGNNPQVPLFSTAKVSQKKRETIDGLRADTIIYKSPQGRSRETLVNLSNSVPFTWGDYIQLYYENDTMPDAAAADEIIKTLESDAPYNPASSAPWLRAPSTAYTMHTSVQNGFGWVRVYDGGKDGTRIATFLGSSSTSEDVVLVHGSCGRSPYGILAHLRLMPAHPSPIHVWDYYSPARATSIVHDGLSIVVRKKSNHDTMWCGELVHTNEDASPPDAGW